jgi:CRISPR system Cascade subunit CasB
MTGNQPSIRQRQTVAFIEALERLDAAGRARLKRNAGRTLEEARDIHRVFFQMLPYDLPDSQYNSYFLIATLFPLADHRGSGQSLGATLQRVRAIRGGEAKANSLDRRVQTLLDSDRDQLPFRLRQAVRLAAADDQAIDWLELLRDILGWQREGRPVQLRWAKDYYVGRSELVVTELQK